jgi:lipase
LSLLIGHSFGAASILRHALRHPDTVRGLVLIEPVYFAVARDEPEYQPYEASEHALRAAVLSGDLEQAARCFLSLNADSPAFDSLPKPARAQMASQMSLVTAARAGLFDDSGNLMTPGLIEGFDKPVLLMRGGRTNPIFFATVRALAQRLPRANVAVVEDAGHMVPISHPTQTAVAVAAWMARNGLADGVTDLTTKQKPRVD